MTNYFEMSKAPFSGFKSAGNNELWTQLYNDTGDRGLNWQATVTDTYDNGGPPLVGNWNEERFDLEYLSKMRPLPSQHNHAFQTTYDKSHNTPDDGTTKIPQSIKYLIDRDPYAYGGHQPELDHPEVKAQCNSWETTYRASYSLPALPHSMDKNQTQSTEVYEQDPPQIVALKAIQKKRAELGPVKYKTMDAED